MELCKLHEIMCQESNRKYMILHLYFPQPRTHLVWSKSASLWPFFFYLQLLIALLLFPLFTPILKTESSLISPGHTFIRLLPLELRFSIPSLTQSILDNEIQPFYYYFYGLKILPSIVSPVGFLVFDWRSDCWLPFELLLEIFSWVDIL